jgi:elongation factor Ts
MAITAAQVNELRRRTSAGMMDCKKALTEANGDFEKAIALLKEWGITKAAKKGDRLASEGSLVAFLADDKKSGSLVEVNCETDFVANTAEYKAFAKELAGMIFKKGFDKQESFDEETTNRIKEGISKFGENIIVNSVKKITAKTVLGAYIHTNFKNGTIVALEAEGNVSTKELEEVANNLAIHVSANAVAAVCKDSIDPALLEAKKAEYAEEVKKSGKPENIVPKIVEGKLQKFYKDETLCAQPYLKNEEITVEEYVTGIAKKNNSKIKVTAFVKTIIGE